MILVLALEEAWLRRGDFAARLESLVAALRADPGRFAAEETRKSGRTRKRDVFWRDRMPRPAADQAALYGGRRYQDQPLRR